jgi:cation transporter-like permease
MAAAAGNGGNLRLALTAAAICLCSFAGRHNNAAHALSMGNGRRKWVPGRQQRRAVPSAAGRPKPSDHAHLLVAAAHHMGRHPWSGDGGAANNNAAGGKSRSSRGGGGTGLPMTRRPSALAAAEPDATETQLAQLKQENDVLRLQVAELEEENLRLHRAGGRSPENIILERFEGERTPLYDENGEEVLPWYERGADGEEGGDGDGWVVLPGQKALLAFNGDNSTEAKVVGAQPNTNQATSATSSLSTPTAERSPVTDLSADLETVGSKSKSKSSSAQPPTTEECADDQYDGLTCPIEPDVSFGDALRDRAYWLCGLLAMQSLSGFILARNEVLLQNHPVIVYFLTMLVGAGGNAGNQASVRVIRGWALGTLNDSTQRQFLNREFKMALCLCGLLSTAGFIRAAAFRTPLPETVAITASLALIVFSSIGLGAILPLVLQKLRVDPAHSSTTIQVIMDILGVVMTVLVSTLMLDSPVGQYIVSKLT